MRTLFCISLVACLIVSACKKDEAPPSPVITNFTPQSGIGKTIFQVEGTGFASAAKDNTVTVSGVNANVINATSTLLTVVAPDVFTTGRIKVVVNSNLTATSPADFVRNYEMRTFAGSTSGFSDGGGTSAKFSTPTGIAIGADGIIFVADRENHRIRKITPDGTATTVAGTGAIGFVDGPLATAQFGFITSIAVDGNGNLFVTEYTSGAVRKISTSGTVSVFAGSTSTFGDVDATGSTARFSNPCGIAADQSGNVYVVDVGNNKIRKITPAGAVSTLAGGVGGAGDGTGTSAQFNFGSSNASVAVDASGNLYVTDVGNVRIRKITPAGIVTTIAGNGSIGITNGTGTAAQFFGPAGITVDSNGNVYVVESLKSLVRKITPGGVVTTLAGTTAGNKDGDVAVAQLNNPIGITCDAAGNLFVADTGNNTVRKVIP